MTWRRRRAVTVLFFAAVLLAVASLSLTIGQIAVPIPDVLAITARRLGFPLASAENVSAMQEAVVWQIRMPRTLVGLLVGAALGISGAVMQGIFANPLADPGIIGVSAGALHRPRPFDGEPVLYANFRFRRESLRRRTDYFPGPAPG